MRIVAQRCEVCNEVALDFRWDPMPNGRECKVCLACIEKVASDVS